MCAECQPTPPRHRCSSLQTERPAGQSVQQLPLPLWEGGIGPRALGLRRPPGVGPCPPRCCLEVWPLSAMKRVQAQAALKTDTPSDGRSFVQREPSGASETESDFGVSLSLRAPGSHAPRSAHLCLLSFPVAQWPRASASPSALLRLAPQLRGRRKRDRLHLSPGPDACSTGPPWGGPLALGETFKRRLLFLLTHFANTWLKARVSTSLFPDELVNLNKASYLN